MQPIGKWFGLHTATQREPVATSHNRHYVENNMILWPWVTIMDQVEQCLVCTYHVHKLALSGISSGMKITAGHRPKSIHIASISLHDRSLWPAGQTRDARTLAIIKLSPQKKCWVIKMATSARSERQLWDRSQMAPRKRGSRNSKCQRIRSTSGMSLWLWHGYSLALRESVLCESSMATCWNRWSRQVSCVYALVHWLSAVWE